MVLDFVLLLVAFLCFVFAALVGTAGFARLIPAGLASWVLVLLIAAGDKL